MFGLSLQKLLVLALIVGAVWYGFKFFGRLDESRKRVERVAKKAARRAVDADAEDMVRCEVCGDYVAAGGAVSCGRAECPYPG